jgi:hypothetical protein
LSLSILMQLFLPPLYLWSFWIYKLLA